MPSLKWSSLHAGIKDYGWRLDVVWSQPADTGMGKHANTQLFMVMDILKVRLFVAPQDPAFNI